MNIAKFYIVLKRHLKAWPNTLNKMKFNIPKYFIDIIFFVAIYLDNHKKVKAG